MRVFLSWSRRRSKAVAEAWALFLPDVLQVVRTFLSSVDLEAGVRWTDDLADALGDMDHGLICVTPENREEPWIHFEAGALSKKPGKSKVVPFLYELDGSQLHASLAQFNYRPFTKEGVFQIVSSINNDLSEYALDPGRLQRAFETYYPDFETRLNEIPKLTEDEQKGVKPERKLEEVVAEILSVVRKQSNPFDSTNLADLRILMRKVSAFSQRSVETQAIDQDELQRLQEAVMFFYARTSMVLPESADPQLFSIVHALKILAGGGDLSARLDYLQKIEKEMTALYSVLS